MRWRMSCAGLLLTIAASGCSTAGPATDGCGWVKPIYPTRADALAIGQDLADQILAHNETGARVGCWSRRPPRPDRVGTVPP